MRDARATTARDVELGHRAEASTRDGARDDDDARARDDDDGERDDAARDGDASPGRAPIAGINEDGYFGDADGAWLPSDRVPLVLRARRRDGARDYDGRATFLDAFGWPIAASAFCVFLLIFALEEFGGANARRRAP